MSFFSRLTGRFRKDGAALRIEPTGSPDDMAPGSAGQTISSVPAIPPEPVPDIEVADTETAPVTPKKAFGIPTWARSRKKGATSANRDVIIGLQVAGSESWMRLNADGHAEELLDLPKSREEAVEIFGSARVFRGMDYDRGLRVPSKLRGKALRNNLMRELNDMPVWFKKEGITWFTRKGSQSIFGYPIRPLAAALGQFAKSRGSTPAAGVLLRGSIPVGTTMLWVFLAIGGNGVGAFQSIRTSAGGNRPTFNPQLASGVLGNDFQTLDLDAAELWSFLASSPAAKVSTYPQRGEWLGKPKTLIGTIVAIGGLSALVIGAGFWFWSEATLHQAMTQARRETARIAQFRTSRQAFFSTHIEGIALLQERPLGHLIQDATSLWKPGTTVIMADGMPLTGSGLAGSGPMGSGPLLASPGAVGALGANGGSGATFQIDIPATKNLGPGQASWVSQRLLHAVISQTPPQGIVLQSVQKTGGNGYVALFGGH